MNVQRRDLGFDPLGMTQQQIALLAGRLVPSARLAWYVRISPMPTPIARRHAKACSVSTSSSRYRRCPLLSSRSIGPISPTCS